MPDTAYGFGTVDAYRALLQVAASVVIIEPSGVDVSGNATDPAGLTPPVETLQPTIRFQVSLVPLSKLTVQIKDGDTTTTVSSTDLANSVESGDASASNATPQYVIALRRRFETFGAKTIIVTGSNADDTITVNDQRTFTITPKTLIGSAITDNAGTVRNIGMVSLPYFETAADANQPQPRDVFDVFGTNVRFWRYNYFPAETATAQGDYARFPHDPNSGKPDRSAFARLRPPDALTTLEGDTTNYAPLGVGFFAELPNPVAVRTFGRDFSKQIVRVRLHEGWNMVGCPYTFPVAFNSVLVETPSGQRLPAAQAADQKLLLPFLYRFLGGQYEFTSLPAGTFMPWEGHWVYVTPQGGTVNPERTITLIFTPSQSDPATRSRSTNLASVNSVTSSPGSWALRLEARTGSLRDSNNFIGVTTASGNQADPRTRAPKPPLPAPYVSLGVTRPELAAKGLYAQDIQQGGGVKTWDVVVATDQKNADVTLAWPGIATVPRNVRLTLTDKATGQTINLRQQSSLQFKTNENAGTRQFVLTARPSNLAGRALFSNVSVNPRRTRGTQPLYEINYSLTQSARVEVSILTFNGQIVSKLGGTRAAETGDNTVVWNGLDTAGRALAAGTYVIQLQAVTQEGDVTREVRPFLLTR